MRALILTSMFVAGCYDYQALSSGLHVTADGATPTDGTITESDLSRSADLGTADAADLAAEDALVVADDLANAGDLSTAADLAPASDLTPPGDLSPASDLACTIVHNNGVGGAWTDCVPFGTHDQAQAFKACQAVTNAACSVGFCGGTTYGILNSTYPYGFWYYAGGAEVGHMAPMAQGCSSGTNTWN